MLVSPDARIRPGRRRRRRGPIPSTTMTVAASPKTPDGHSLGWRRTPHSWPTTSSPTNTRCAIRRRGSRRLVAAAHRQQAAYRAIGQHPEWDGTTRPRIPATLLDVYDRNVDARRQLTAITPVRYHVARVAHHPAGTSGSTARLSTTKPRRTPVSAGTT